MRVPRFFRFFRYLNCFILRKTLTRSFRQRLTGLSAEIAFNSMLAVFPAILAIITAIGLFEESIVSSVRSFVVQFFPEEESIQTALRELATKLKIVAPDLVWGLLSNFVQEITQVKSKSLFSISFGAAIWVSSAAINAAMNALDQIHLIPRRRRRPFWQAKLIALLLTLGSIFLLLVASISVLIGDALVQFSVNLIQAIPLRESDQGADLILELWNLLKWPVSLSIVIVAFALIYRLGPSHWRKGTPILPGAIVAALSWAGISLLFRVYVNNFANYNKVYGALGAVIVLMLWLYLSALVMLIGGQLNVTVGEAMRADHRRRQIIAQPPPPSTFPSSLPSSESGDSSSSQL
ncbi:YihY/virulence factor BrkB family protein [Spirulina subsalsa FACHB-351]|uniref:YihY/virulence factor BrkB family protein n=1 Tax=Spirulina subsalsa FACHB-351 TaxID=234711 RepID=A0ABT3L2I5_9CYAN|nr:YihY/virulence factor BrkB family protein [Spirulina subsalsa]MCW6035711.1 YihY/virulence factor BrkB family protein [Spirulina subsalsa FACHB-351]